MHLQGPCFNPELELPSGFSLGFLVSSHFPKKHACKWTGYSILPLGVAEWVNGCVNGGLPWTGIPARIYSQLMSSVPKVDSMVLLSRIKCTFVAKVLIDVLLNCLIALACFSLTFAPTNHNMLCFISLVYTFK